jgi:hypothetical protein
VLLAGGVLVAGGVLLAGRVLQAATVASMLGNDWNRQSAEGGSYFDLTVDLDIDVDD